MTESKNNIVSGSVPQGEIVLYQPDATTRLEVRLEEDTVWLTQTQIVDLFQSSKGNISEHIKNIYAQKELEPQATVRDFRTVRKEGNRMVSRNLTYYNLDAIISIGFRVNTKRGIEFRQWANKVLKEYMVRGYAVNRQLMQMDDALYHFGASFKDLGRRLFAFELMGIDKDMIIQQL